MLKCCFTGYRPSKFPFNMCEDDNDYIKFENALTKEIFTVCNEGCRVFYTGMAEGFDIIAAEIVLQFKELFKPSLKLVCVVPFENQAQFFSENWKKRYYNVLSLCDEKIVLSKDYFKGCYQKRNIFMVDNSDYLLTWYDGKSGGTRNTIDYAAKIGRYIFNANKEETENFAIQTSFEIK